MKRSVWHVLMVVAGLCVTGSAYADGKAASPAAYEEGSYVSNEIATLRAEVDSLRRQLDGSVSTGYDDKKPAPAGDAGCCCQPSCCQPCCNDCCQSSCCNDCCNNCCNNGCCQQGHVFVDFDATFFRYHRADGFGVDNVFGMEFAPRVTLGYVGANGFGLRARWWEYDHSGYDPIIFGNVVADTYNIDVEVFEEVALGCSTGLEWSAGIRYNDFREETDLLGRQTFSAPGILLGAKVYHSLPIGGAMFASFKAAWLMSDWSNEFRGYFVGIDPTYDVTRVVTEAAIGYEYRTCLSSGAVLSLRTAVEMQNWESYTQSTDFIIPFTPVDVGFGGFVLGGAITY